MTATRVSTEKALRASVVDMVPMAEERRPEKGKASGPRAHCMLMLTRPTIVESASTSGAAAAGSSVKMAACWPFQECLRVSTTSATSFKYESESALAAQGTLIKEVKADLRKEHFNFGNEVVQYETDAQRSMKNGEITPARLGEMKHDAKAAQDLKIKLLATSVVIGDDPTYMR